MVKKKKKKKKGQKQKNLILGEEQKKIKKEKSDLYNQSNVLKKSFSKILFSKQFKNFQTHTHKKFKKICSGRNFLKFQD